MGWRAWSSLIDWAFRDKAAGGLIQLRKAEVVQGPIRTLTPSSGLWTNPQDQTIEHHWTKVLLTQSVFHVAQCNCKKHQDKK